MATIEFELLAGRSYLARGPTAIGLYKLEGGGIILVDAGNDEDRGRRILRSLEAHGQKPALIVLTHSNADHAGGAAFIAARTGCEVATTRIEAAFVENPILEPSLLWGGFPHAALRNKFLMAPALPVRTVLEPPCEIGDTGVKVLPLPGHFLGMIGLMTPDRVFYAADSLASEEILAKYHLFFYYDLAAALETLSFLEGLEAEWIVPSHAPPTQDIRPLVQVNRAKIHEVAAFLLGQTAAPVSLEGLFARVVQAYAIELNPSQYVLVGSTVKSYLSWLLGKGELTSWFEEGRLYFKRS